jgi:hypothetical protein
MPLRGSVLWLAPHAEVQLSLDATVALKPTADSTEAPDDLFEDYRTPIQAGAIGALAEMDGKAWTSGKNAMKFGAIFEQWKGKALLRQSRGNTRAAIRTTSNYRF